MTRRRAPRRADSLTRYECASGESNAAILNAMLDNPEADRFIAERAIERAIAGGMSRESALSLYRSRE